MVLASEQCFIYLLLVFWACQLSGLWNTDKGNRPSANAIYYNAMLYTTAEALHTGNMQLGISTDAEGTDMAVSEAVYGYYKPRT